MGIKDKSIKIRVTDEEKELIKRVSKLQNSNMSDFVMKHIVSVAENKELNIKNKEIIENRINQTEENIKKLKDTLKLRKENTKKSWFSKIFSNQKE